MIYTIALLFLAFLLLKFRTSQTTKDLQKVKQDFWNKEHKANDTRKKDISSLNYLTIPMNELPMSDTSDATLQDIYGTIERLSNSSILNLTGISNTDLKLNYGVANLIILSEADNNYTQLVNAVNKWGAYLYQTSKIHDAKTVLEYGVACKTDISNNYTLLATIYKELNEKNKIDILIEEASSINTLRKDSILVSLNALKSN